VYLTERRLKRVPRVLCKGASPVASEDGASVFGVNPVVALVFPLCLLPLLLRRDGSRSEKKFFKRQRWGAAEVVISVVFVHILLFVVYTLGQSSWVRPLLYRNYSLIGLLPLVFLLLLFRYKIKEPIRLLGFRRRSICMNILFILAFGAPLIFGALLDVPALLVQVKGFLVQRAIVGSSFPVTAFLVRAQMTFTCLVTIPLAEEGIYRGILYAPFRRKYGPMGAVFLTSVLFTAAHSDAAPWVFLVSIVLAVLYEKTGSFTAIVIGHMTANGLALIVHT
jgi:membrane protease YdiL (CAAX protease family)